MVTPSDYTPSAKFVLSPTTYHQDGWYLGGSGIYGTGNVEKALDSNNNDSNRNWNAVVKQTAANFVTTEEFTLTWTLFGTSTDNNCIGTSNPPASVTLRLLDGRGSIQSSTDYNINVTDDDLRLGWRQNCSP